MTASKALIVNQILELRRGTIVLAILSQLSTPRYGYGLLESLKAAGITVDAGTLYPLLRRLESQEVLVSSWEMGDTRPRKYYQLSEAGVQLYKELTSEWESMATIIETMIKESKK